MELWNILGNIVILLGASLLVGGVFSRLGQSPLIGYLLAGMMLGGPGSIQVVSSEHEIEAIAELGVALLLFSHGLEFSIVRLKKLGARPLLGGCTASPANGPIGYGCSTPVRLGNKRSSRRWCDVISK